MSLASGPVTPRELRFECQRGCIRCCDRKGWVYLTQADLDNAARFLGIPSAEFEQRYVYRTRHLIRLRKPPGRQCEFLRPDGCSIHPAKPTQCRLFPYWPELVERRAAWEAAGTWCPGIGKGKLIQIGQAMEIASEMRTAYPSTYE